MTAKTRDLSEIIERIQDEIRRDVEVGDVPSDVASFSDLQDYVDANMYGESDPIFASLTDPPDFPDLNRVQDLIDRWIKAGGIGATRRDYLEPREDRDVPLSCGDCGRPTGYDYGREDYFHAEDGTRGCFLIAATTSDVAENDAALYAIWRDGRGGVDSCSFCGHARHPDDVCSADGDAPGEDCGCERDDGGDGCEVCGSSGHGTADCPPIDDLEATRVAVAHAAGALASTIVAEAKMYAVDPAFVVLPKAVVSMARDLLERGNRR